MSEDFAEVVGDVASEFSRRPYDFVAEADLQTRVVESFHRELRERQRAV